MPLPCREFFDRPFYNRTTGVNEGIGKEIGGQSDTSE